MVRDTVTTKWASKSDLYSFLIKGEGNSFYFPVALYFYFPEAA